jgi:hypothetical protein
LKYEQINSEIEAAFGTGRLKRQFVIHPLLGSNLGQLATYLPEGITSVLAMKQQSIKKALDAGYESAIFDQACLRRRSLTSTGPMFEVAGWVLVESTASRVTNVIVADSSGNFGKVSPTRRVDVAEGYGATHGFKPEVAGFQSTISEAEGKDFGISYVVDNTLFIRGREFIPGHVATLTSAERPGLTLLQGIDRFTLVDNSPSSGSAQKVQLFLQRVGDSSVSGLLQLLVIAAGATVCAANSLRTADSDWRRIAVFFGLLLALWSSRILFYSLIQAVGWTVESRYLFTAQLIEVVLQAYSIGIFWKCVKPRLRFALGTEASAQCTRN